MAVADSTQAQLDWEARQRPRAGAAGVLAGVLLLGADLWSGAVFRDAPHPGFLGALQQAAQPGPMGTTRSPRDAFFAFYHAHVGEIFGASAARAIGLLGLAWLLTFLAAATRARRPELPRFATWLPAVGGVLQAVASILLPIASATNVSNYLSGPRTVDAADQVSSGSLLVASSFIGLVGQLALAAGFILVCLNAMRAGLLTRFMGVLGVIVGILNVIPLGPLPIVQAFWLLALGALLFGRWPGAGVPPAWRTGRAEAWPSQAELAERRRATAEARRGRGRGASAPPPPDPEAPERPVAVAGTARRKRKRKR